MLAEQDVTRRSCWVKKISSLSGDFGVDAGRVEQELAAEIQQNGLSSLLSHLRLCGVIPEGYAHDSSEEKLYSKYTDAVIHEAFAAMGLTSLVLKERADAADVECVCDNYSFVADAKAFRLSRTAKNQKDFKIQALDGWKRGKPFAMVVCPVYQLPARASQIYQQAAARSVCISTYTHLAVLVRHAESAGKISTVSLLHNIFQAVEAMNPSQDAGAYWQTLNRTLLGTDDRLAAIWREEKIAALESIRIAQEEALAFLAAERERIMRLSHEEAIHEVLRQRKIENRIRAVKSVADNGLLEAV
ncbi:HindIII family type II restriction endonuclease [Candidatus Electronema sp. JM]|uniref:HindIII family type II restriction endonuclease n=1 Tax=Candidatus Electronema sp. JM TaxID=3401571 RepID=UPI003AA8ED59